MTEEINQRAQLLLLHNPRQSLYQQIQCQQLQQCPLRFTCVCVCVCVCGGGVGARGAPVEPFCTLKINKSTDCLHKSDTAPL